MDGGLPEAVDVLVIGAGLAGSACALRLARGGASVALVDAGPLEDPVLPDPVDLGVVEHPHRTLHALGDEPTRALYAFADANRSLLAAEGLLEAGGVTWSAVDPAELPALDASAEALARLGRVAERLDAGATDERTGGIGFHGGLTVRDGGRLVAGARSILRQRARDAGVHVLPRREARLDDPSSGPVRVALGDGVVCAEVVVIAAGHASAALDPRLADAVLPVREGGLWFEPSARRVADVGRAGQGWTCWRAQANGVLVSGARWATPHLEVGEHVPALDPRVRGRLEGFASRFLRLAHPVGERAWIAAQTRDQLPVIGPLPGHSRRIACFGFGTNGATWAVAAGAAVADGLLGEGGDVPDVLASRRLVRWSR